MLRVALASARVSISDSALRFPFCGICVAPRPESLCSHKTFWRLCGRHSVFPAMTLQVSIRLQVMLEENFFSRASIQFLEFACAFVRSRHFYRFESATKRFAKLFAYCSRVGHPRFSKNIKQFIDLLAARIPPMALQFYSVISQREENEMLGFTMPYSVNVSSNYALASAIRKRISIAILFS